MCELKWIVEQDDSLKAFPIMFKDGKANFIQLQSKIRRYAKLESETSSSLVALLDKQINELSFCLGELMIGTYSNKFVNIAFLFNDQMLLMV